MKNHMILELKKLKEIYEKFFQKSEVIKIIDSVRVNLDTEIGLETFKRFNKNSIIEGYEGIMIKDPESNYECKRSNNMVKIKAFYRNFLRGKRL